jgi:HK97 family phage major capsid protein
VPIYAPPAGDQPATLYGRQLNEVLNGGWVPADAALITGDWSKAIVGIRQDITFRIFTEGVISDDDGVVILNLMQQDSVAMRAVMRIGWALANPINPLHDDDATRSYFGVLTP